ncbi:hypothetical protein JCM11491_005950 [Sporobolomyces phaffii]
MRQKRVKGYRKVMQLYCAAFGFREPYQLLVDAAFLRSCVQQKLDFTARLQDVLQGTVKPMITQCCIQALYDQGPEGQAAVDLAKEFERRKCNHLKPRPESECLESVCRDENRNRYVVATQSTELRSSLRKVPGTPIVYIARSVVLLESPSDQTLAKKHAMETSKLHAPAAELALLSGKPLVEPRSRSTSPPASDDDKDADSSTTTAAAEPKKKKKQRGPKGPNPLSVPKKKKAKALTAVQAGKKRARDELDDAARDRKRKREDNERVVVTSLAARHARPPRTPASTTRRGGDDSSAAAAVEEGAGAGAGGGGGDAGKKKRKRRKKASGGGGDDGGNGGNSSAPDVPQE